MRTVRDATGQGRRNGIRAEQVLCRKMAEPFFSPFFFQPCSPQCTHPEAPTLSNFLLQSPIHYNRTVWLKVEWIWSLFDYPALKTAPNTHKETEWMDVTHFSSLCSISCLWSINEPDKTDENRLNWYFVLNHRSKWEQNNVHISFLILALFLTSWHNVFVVSFLIWPEYFNHPVFY